jgi:hypothetical protein
MTGLEMMRHAVATLAYRAAKATRDVNSDFAGFRAGPESRTPVEILAHMGDLFDWALSMADGAPVWRESPPLPWEQERERFFAALTRFDARLAALEPPRCDIERLFQGPVSDALTHTGQIAFLRGLSGSHVKGESYNHADILIGRTGTQQIPPDPRYEF